MGFNVGEQVGDYQILQVLGAGGMGKVYKVRNVITDRIEALKVLLPDLTSDAELADRFAREVRMLASLSHPNIAGLHTAVKVNNQLLMVMEYVEGETVAKELTVGALPTGRALEYADQALTALAYAHSHNIIHRDIKPANFMVTTAGVVKLMDFGIARPTEDSRLTQTGRTVGSLAYMSPEQINGVALDSRADIYSFGISLYEMVTGTLPFKGTSDFSIMAGHLQQQPVPPIQIDPKLPPMLSDIVLMAIAKDRDQRFQTAEAMRGALRNIHNSVTEMLTPGAAPKAQPQPVHLPPPPPPTAAPPYTPAAEASSHRGLYVAVGSLLTLGLLGLAAYEVPKLMHSSAATVVTEQKAEQKPAAPVASTEAQKPSAFPDAQPNQAANPTVEKAEANPVSAPAADPTPQPTAPTQTQATPLPLPVREPARRPAPTQQAYQAQPVQQPPVQQMQQNPDTGRISSSPVPERPPVQQAQNADQLEEVREQYIKLAAREKSAESSLARLERSMAATGGGLRGDMIEARQRMGFYLNDAESALRSGNSAAALRALEKADREVSKIEAFLGR